MNSHSLATITRRPIVLLVLIATPVAFAADLPDPAKLITVAELEPIVGRIVAGPAPVTDYGVPACSYTVSGDARLEIILFPNAAARLAFAKRTFGGAGAVPLPELGKDAFANPSARGDSAVLYGVKGDVLLNVSMPAGDGAVEKLRAIAKKALARLP